MNGYIYLGMLAITFIGLPLLRTYYSDKTAERIGITFMMVFWAGFVLVALSVNAIVGLIVAFLSPLLVFYRMNKDNIKFK